MTEKSVLVVGPSRKTRGGITAVIEATEQCSVWKDWNCYWIETHVDGSVWQKIRYFVFAYWSFALRVLFCDIVHIHLSEPIGALRKTFFHLTALFARKKIIIHFHSFSPETTTGGMWKWLYVFLFRTASQVVVLSPFWEKELTKVAPKSCVSILLNPCISLGGDTISRINTSGVATILFAGTVTPRKGCQDLISAIALLVDKHPNIRLVVAGNGDIGMMKKLATNLGVINHVEFLGWVTGSEKDRAFREADIFCLPSYAEGFPMAVLDAIAYGIPIVTTPVGGIPDYLINNENAVLVNPGDVKQISEAILALVTDPDFYRKLSEASRKMSVTTFSLREMNEKLEIIYSSLACRVKS